MTTFNTDIKRIGFACKPSTDETGVITSIPEMNCKTTTLSWLGRQTKKAAEERLWSLLKHNIQSINNSIRFISERPPELRMFRMSSDIIPVYNHHDWKYFYESSEVRTYMENSFARVGELARNKDVRLSMHPDQFCCIASANPQTVENSIAELEYHATIARMMGFGNSKLDMKINIHLSGTEKKRGLDLVWNKLSLEMRNCLTLENDEFQSSLNDILSCGDKVGIVLDIHHHFINTGEYIMSTDDRIKRVIDSWQGVRPTFHYSVSREDYLEGHCPNTLPDMNHLLSTGHKKQKLRAHSDYMWNKAVNDWARSHYEWADCMVECKSKNLGSMKLYEDWAGI